MSIRYRAMRPYDVCECAGIVARHPALAPRYGDAIRHLESAWLRLLGSDGFSPTVFEEIQGARTVMLGAGIAVFVTDDFIAELKSESPFWIGPELTVRMARGKSPVLTDIQVRNANSYGGLNLAVWQTGVSPDNLVRLDAGAIIMTAFVEGFRGFLLKESVTQAESAEHVQALRLAGGLFWNSRKRSYSEAAEQFCAALVGKPHVIGMSRDLGPMYPGSWAASMFLYQPPRFGLSRSEQCLLLSALHGATDQDLSEELGISLFTTKKTWRSIYDRVAACSPELIPYDLARENGNSERGKEKKKRLIAYLRNHPEELRPASRKLLQQSAPLHEVKAPA